MRASQPARSKDDDIDAAGVSDRCRAADRPRSINSRVTEKTRVSIEASRGRPADLASSTTAIDPPSIRELPGHYFEKQVDSGTEHECSKDCNRPTPHR